MKKITLLLSAMAVMAASVHAQVNFAPELGLNLSNYSFKEGSFSINSGMRAGLRVGGMTDIRLTDNLYLQPGLLYVMNGFKWSFDFIGQPNTIKASVSTIEIPVNLLYKAGKPGKGRLFVGGGPYIAYNIGGNIKSTVDGITTSEKMKIGNDSTCLLKPLDIGIGINIGYEFTENFYARLHSQYGFTNLLPISSQTNANINSYNFGLSFGYIFVKKTKKEAKKK